MQNSESRGAYALWSADSDGQSASRRAGPVAVEDGRHGVDAQSLMIGAVVALHIAIFVRLIVLA